MMPTGPGKYDALATVAREAVNAETVIVIILGGDSGDGFSVQSINPGIARHLPRLLRATADDIETSLGDNAPGRPISITCPRCRRTSYNLNDVAHRYCGHCHQDIP